MKVNDVTEIAQMSIPEKILFIEDLWDNLTSTDSEVPVPESHTDELDKRLAKDYSPGDLSILPQLYSFLI